jgi:drug/metabolite transporter (DMT)-like permease
MVCLLGVVSTLGHYLMILSYSLASPATLTPYLYFQIAFATLAGWLVFSQVPDSWSLLGIAMIAVCGGGQQLARRAQALRTCRERTGSLAWPLKAQL